MGACYLLQFPNGKVYVGITLQSAPRRWINHQSAARRGAKYILAHAVRKYGPESVTVHVLAESEDWAELCQYERMFIALFGSQHRALGYNMTSGGEGAPDPSSERREQQRQVFRRTSCILWSDPDYRETRRAQSVSQWADPEYRKRTSSAIKQRRLKPDQVEKQSALSQSYWKDPEYRAKMRAAMQVQWSDPEYREMMARLAKARWDDPDYKQRVVAAAKARNQTPEGKAVRSAAQKGQKARALAALYASVEDYGEFTAIGVPDPTDFVDRVRVAAMQSPMGYHQLATVAGMSSSGVHKFVTRRLHLSEPTLCRLAEVLGVTDANDQTFSTAMM